MEYVLRTITDRHSTRSFRQRAVSDTVLQKLLTAATCAPSGRNAQPWGFAVIDDRKTILRLSKVMRRSRFIEMAPCLIAVYKVHKSCYDNEKDALAIGAAVQNMLLCAHEMGLGACWVGENMDKAEELLSESFHSRGCTLMSLVAVGYRDHNPEEESRPLPLRKPIHMLRRKKNEL